MARYAFSIDLDRCIGCQACVVACKTGNERPAGNNYIRVTETVRGQLPNLIGSFIHHRCFHCADAACVAVCPTGTLAKWNGLTTVTAEKCSGCGYCTDACPYKVPNVVDGRVAKCVACLDLVQDGQAPWCAQTCPSQAIKFGERDKLLAEAKAQVATLKTRHPNAQVYGETQLGGLGLLMIAQDAPEVLGLPENPQTPAELNVWQSAVQPVGIGLSALSAVVTGLLFVVARRQHASEKTALHKATEEAAHVTAVIPPVTPAPIGSAKVAVATETKPTPTHEQEIASGVARPRHDVKPQTPVVVAPPQLAQPAEPEKPVMPPVEKTAVGKEDVKPQVPAAKPPIKPAQPPSEKDKGDK